MDKAAAMLMALRAASGLGNARLEPARIEALAGTLGLKSEDLPGLVARWQKAGKVTVHWGGVLEVLPEQSGSASVIINAQGASNSTIAGRDATGGFTITAEAAAFGSLAAVITKMQECRPSLQGDAAVAAENVDQLLKAPPAASAPAEVRRDWASNVRKWLGQLLKSAPEVKDLVYLGKEAVKGLGWG